jgi:hypothetical protein
VNWKRNSTKTRNSYKRVLTLYRLLLINQILKQMNTKEKRKSKKELISKIKKRT